MFHNLSQIEEGKNTWTYHLLSSTIILSFALPAYQTSSAFWAALSPSANGSGSCERTRLSWWDCEGGIWDPIGWSMGTFPETNSLPLKMDGWNTSFLLGWPIFRGELLVSGRLICSFRLSIHTWLYFMDKCVCETSQIQNCMVLYW